MMDPVGGITGLEASLEAVISSETKAIDASHPTSNGTATNGNDTSLEFLNMLPPQVTRTRIQ